MEVGNININFSIFSDDPLYLQIMDLSEWRYAKNLPSYISILVPGSKKPKVFSFTKEMFLGISLSSGKLIS